MHKDTGELLLACSTGIYAVLSEQVQLRVSSTVDTVLYRNPTFILARALPHSCFTMNQANLELQVSFDGASKQTLAVEICDPRKIHFYRRLLAQTVLSMIGPEGVCVRLLQCAIDSGKLSMRELVQCLQAPAVVCETLVSVETFVRCASEQQLMSLAQQRLGASFELQTTESVVDNIDGYYFFSTTWQCGSVLHESNVFAHTLPQAQRLSMLHLIACGPTE